MAGEPAVTTASAWRRFLAAVVALSGAVALVIVAHSGTASPSTPQNRAVTFEYSCCRASLVNTVYHPGQVMVVRWIRHSVAPGVNPLVTISLSARLSGPFSSVSSLKSTVASASASASALGAVDVASPVVRVSNTSGASPLSELRIPADAAPGFYDLTLTIGSGPSVAQWAHSVVRIAQ